MKPAQFDYMQPETVEEAVGLLAEFGSDAVLLAGGMSLGPMLNLRLVRPSVVIDIGKIVEIGKVEAAAEGVTTGAGLRQRDALHEARISAGVPLLAQALPWVGHMQTRNRGTLGGSVAHADPSAEIPLCLVTLAGKVVLRSRRRTRTLAARDFFLGMLMTARAPDEMIVGLEWPRTRSGEGFAFEEIAQRHGDFAIAAVACRVRLENETLSAITVGVGGVEDRPVAIDLEDLEGSPANETVLDAAADAVAGRLEPLSDRAASGAQRRALARALTRRTAAAALDQARGMAA